MKTPRFTSIDLDLNFQLGGHFMAKVAMHWKGAMLDQEFVEHMTFMGVKELDVQPMGFDRLVAKHKLRFRVMFRDSSQVAEHMGELDDLRPSGVRGMAVAIVESIARERSEQGTMYWPGSEFPMESAGGVSVCQLHDLSPPVFPGEPLVLVAGKYVFFPAYAAQHNAEEGSLATPAGRVASNEPAFEQSRPILLGGQPQIIGRVKV